ncbi:aspartate aminotransferase family protein [Seleniivibrio woodruffii]|uniref:aspartate aminotransferase family protein n=1 Tax=Seleniivibrio woodruffii TaxID=1078050 RepID=UPI0039E6373D
MGIIFDKYTAKFKKSKELYEKSRTLFPNGVCHDIRNHPPFPVVTDRCEGIYMTDADGHQLIDLWMGHYANILGHGSDAQKRGMERALAAGVHHGTLNRYQIEYAELVQRAIPELESMRFCTSGTEATMYVTRVARAFTGRHVIIKAEGGWHGGNSVLSTGVVPPFSKSSGPEGQKTVAVPYNDIEKTAEILRAHSEETAAIIIEPMMGSGGGITAAPEYLKLLRDFCDLTGTLLIFDEVITGFRFRWGSIWPLLGVKPDLFTFGKAAAGGIHIGIYGGRRDVMDIITKQKLFVGGGTYSANPVAMCVGIETLKDLETADYDKLNKAGEDFRQKLTTMTKDLPYPAYVTGFGSFFCVHFLDARFETITPQVIMTHTDKDRENLFKAAMLLNNVFTMHAGGAFSFMHLNEMTNSKLTEAYRKSFEMI